MNDKINKLMSTQDSILLEKCLRHWNWKYRIGDPEIDDATYDMIYDKLKQLDENNFFLSEVGLKSKTKERIPYFMGSLETFLDDNIKSWINKFDEFNEYVISHKLDGVSVEAEYKYGILKNAWLRGDGEKGENITNKCFKFMGKLQTNKYDTIFVRGEIMFIGNPVDIGMKNRRNAVAGIIRRDDGKHLEHLSLITHGWLNPFKEYQMCEYDRLQFLSKLLPTVRHELIDEYQLGLNKLIEKMQLLYNEDKSYDIDGVVIAINNSSISFDKRPKNKVAYKINRQVTETHVTNIEWNISRTGKIIPLVYIKPVELGGTTISKTSGFNAGFIMSNELGIGSKIILTRSGDVIPYIQKVLTTSDLNTTPKICPSCESPLVWEGNYITATNNIKPKGVNLVCTNPKCEDMIQNYLYYFFSRLGLEHFGKKKIESLNCKSIEEIYNLTFDQVRRVDGWGDKSSYDFIKRINDTRKTTPVLLLSALGIPLLGKTLSKLIINESGYSFENLFIESIMNETIIKSRLCQLDGISLHSATLFVNAFKEKYEMVKSLLKYITFIEEDVDTITTKSILNGNSYCITGKLSKPRKTIEKWIIENGGEIKSVSSCNILICNEKSNSSKYNQAIKRGIIIMTEDELYG